MFLNDNSADKTVERYAEAHEEYAVNVCDEHFAKTFNEYPSDSLTNEDTSCGMQNCQKDAYVKVFFYQDDISERNVIIAHNANKVIKAKETITKRDVGNLSDIFGESMDS